MIPAADAATAYLASIPSPARGVWYLGPLPIRAYALFIIAGIIVAVIWGGRRFVARGGVPGRVTDIAVWAVPFGLVGGRLYHVITDNELYFRPGRNPWKAFAIWDGGLGIWGAVALGAVGAWIGCRRYRVSFTAFADAIAPGVIVAQALGRMGNYFNQELFGARTDLPWGLEVFLRTPGGGPGDVAMCGTGAPEFPTDYIKASPEVLCGTFQPTFLYELLWNLAVAVLLVWADRRFKLGGGRVFWLYVAGYTAGRTWIEMLRIDTANHFLGLRINVFTSIVMFLVAVGFLIVLRHKHREPVELVRGVAPHQHGAPASEEDASGQSSEENSSEPVDLAATSDETSTKSAASEKADTTTEGEGASASGHEAAEESANSDKS